MRKSKWISLLVVVFLMGCTSKSVLQSTDGYLPFSVPLQPNARQEIMLARLSMALSDESISKKERAQLLAQRGYLFDSIGLAELSRADFENALRLDPSDASTFNMLGMLFTQQREFDTAFEAFDASLALNPNNPFALMNRGIALYYADRYSLALDDIIAANKYEPEEPYYSLWLYIVGREVNGSKQSRDQLLKLYQENKDTSTSEEAAWGWTLVGMMLDQVNDGEQLKIVEEQATDNVVLAQKLTEAYFYLAKKYQYKGQYKDAIALYKRAIALNVYGFLEHKVSFLELVRIAQIQKRQKMQNQELEEESENKESAPRKTGSRTRHVLSAQSLATSV